MQRVTQFSFRVSKDERQAIADLAAWLQRSQSDAVRFVVIEAARQLTQVNSDSARVDALPKSAQEIKQSEGGIDANQ